MLRELRLQNYAIVDELSLTFSDGFNVITGETGAGKSILVDAIALLLGGRSCTEDIRAGAEEAVLEARFDSPATADNSSPQEEIILKRVLSRTGKGRAYLNGSLASLSSLKEAGQKLAEIHGQHEQYSLLNPSLQLDLLDAAGALRPQREVYAAHYCGCTQLKSEQQKLRQQAEIRLRQSDFLRYQLSEIEGARLQPDEEERLLKEAQHLKNWETIQSAAQDAHTLLVGEGAILNQLDAAGSAIQRLHTAAGDTQPESDLWETARIHLKELATLLRARFGEVDPDRLNEVTERLYLIQQLKKKYGPSYEAIVHFRERLSDEIASLSDSESREAALTTQIAELEAICREEARALSKARVARKARLEKQVKAEMDALGMEQTHFGIAWQEAPLSETGMDQISFQIALPGETPHDLDKIASGGELSRIMLALKAVLADAIPTLIFDEVDAGVGGAIAERIGLRLLRLAQSHQLFCITHLPQIARFAQHHYLVQKKSGDRVVASIRALSEEERIAELARMLGGVTMTSITLRHAEEMLRGRVP
jgi:DNA repair protein RecN (Recombination protein N)